MASMKHITCRASAVIRAQEEGLTLFFPQAQHTLKHPGCVPLRNIAKGEGPQQQCCPLRECMRMQLCWDHRPLTLQVLLLPGTNVKPLLCKNLDQESPLLEHQGLAVRFCTHAL